MITLKDFWNAIWGKNGQISLQEYLKDIDAYQKELKNNFNINKELSNLSGKMTLKFGRFVAVASAAMITAKNIDFEKNAKSEEIIEQSSPTAE